MLRRGWPLALRALVALFNITLRVHLFRWERLAGSFIYLARARCRGDKLMKRPISLLKSRPNAIPISLGGKLHRPEWVSEWGRQRAAIHQPGIWFHANQPAAIAVRHRRLWSRFWTENDLCESTKRLREPFWLDKMNFQSNEKVFAVNERNTFMLLPEHVLQQFPNVVCVFCSDFD